MSEVGLDDELCFLPLSTVAERVRSRNLSPVELVRSQLSRINRVGPRLNCFITVLEEQALAQADEAERLLDAGEYRGPLHGIPISLKDNIATAGIRTTAGSRILSDWVPTRNAKVVDQLQRAGAIIIAKAQLSEFAYGAVHPDYSLPLNPWDPERSTGGSSSGSASALAGGLCFASLGTDTGGSIRIPSSMCGVVGLKPTFDLVSRDGVVPISSNLDHVGPMARSVRDVALILEALTEGANWQRRSGLEKTDTGLAGLRVGVLDRSELVQASQEVVDLLRATYRTIEDLGAVISEVKLPNRVQARTAMWTIAGCELADYQRPNLRNRPQDFGPEVRTALERSEFVPATAYVRAQRVRRWIMDQLNDLFESVDILITPAVPIPAHKIADRAKLRDARQAFTPMFNLTGQPALVLPLGLSEESLPLSIQLVGRRLEDDLVLRVAHALEAASKFSERRTQVLSAL